jgi:tRNA(His) guanylyltransferase
MNNKQSLGDRMKLYESINKKFLIPNIPVIIRLDGKAFHSFTKRMNKKILVLK